MGVIDIVIVRRAAFTSIHELVARGAGGLKPDCIFSKFISIRVCVFVFEKEGESARVCGRVRVCVCACACV